MESVNRSLKIGFFFVSFVIVFNYFGNNSNLSAQSISGFVVGPDKMPVIGATVYISQLKIGTLANNNGKFEIKVPAGTYTVEFRSLGFKPELLTLQVTDKTQNVVVYLAEQTYSIPEVNIKKGKEDPAYAIMRKAIALAPYYQNQVKHYKSKVYIKGSINFIKIPKVVEILIRSQGFPFRSGDAHMMESINEIQFNSPDKYVQKVISSHSTFPNMSGIEPMGFITGTFYQPKFYGAISPLSPNAFNYYHFRYEGVTFENGYSILKIGVIPKQKSINIFSGFLYLVDKSYNIHSIDFSIDFEFGQTLIKQQYVNVNGQSWLPVSHSIAQVMKGFGGKAEAYYVVSVKYDQLEVNNSLTKPLWLNADKTNSDKPTGVVIKPLKNQAEIDKIMKKGEINNRDMLKLAKIMKKEMASDTDKNVDKLEIKKNFEYKIEKDAGKKDSLFWSENRPIALVGYELKSLNKNDSLIKIESSDTTSKKEHKKHISPSSVIFGRAWADPKHNYYKFSGLFNPLKLSFNTIDGFSYSIGGFMFKKIDSTHWITLDPALGYSWVRQNIYFKLHFELIYLPVKMGNLSFEAGHWSSDFNHERPIDATINTFASLFFKTNYLKLFDSKYFNISNKVELLNGFTCRVKFAFDKRTSLLNGSDFSFFYQKRAYTSNVPDHPDSTINTGNYISSEASVQLEYTPFMKYRFYTDGRKSYVGSDFPTFIVEVRKGISGLMRSNSDYLACSATIKQEITWGLESKFHYKITTGNFFNHKDVHFADYFQPLVQESPFNIENIQDNFTLLPYYRTNTRNNFIEAHVTYSSPRLILKYLPLLNLTRFSEDIYFNYLHSNIYENHMEMGYGIGKLYLSNGNIIFFCGFDKYKFISSGLKIVIELK